MTLRYLFDRLANPLDTPPTSHEERVLWLRRAITDELQRLFGQRSFFAGLSEQSQSLSEPSIMNFGLPDVISHSANIDSMQLFAEQIKRMVLHYEPRLLHPEVSLESTDSTILPASIKISGVISAGAIQEEFSWRNKAEESEVSE